MDLKAILLCRSRLIHFAGIGVAPPGATPMQVKWINLDLITMFTLGIYDYKTFAFYGPLHNSCITYLTLMFIAGKSSNQNI